MIETALPEDPLALLRTSTRPVCNAFETGGRIMYFCAMAGGAGATAEVVKFGLRQAVKRFISSENIVLRLAGELGLDIHRLEEVLAYFEAAQTSGTAGRYGRFWCGGAKSYRFLA